MKKSLALCLTTLSTLLLLCGSAFPQMATSTATNLGYTVTHTVDTFDSTTNCATRLCLKNITTGAPTQGFKQVESAKTGLDTYGLGWDGYIYHLNMTPTFQSPPAPAAWVQMTALGHTAVNSGLAVKDSATIFALGGTSGCANGARVVEKANAALTGWNSLNPVHCSTSLAVANDGTLVSIDASTGLFTYRLPGVTTWAQAMGSGYSQSAAVTNSAIAYGIKYVGFTGTLYQIDLTTGQSALVTLNLPSGSPVTVPWMVSVDAANNLWMVSRQGQLWHQPRPTTLTLGATGPVWNSFWGTASTTNMVGFSGFNFVLSGTVISHLNLTGLQISVQSSGAYPPPCPLPDFVHPNCHEVVHTVRTVALFKIGGFHPGTGVVNSASGGPLDQIGTSSFEQTTDCDPLNFDDSCDITLSEGDADCSGMGIFLRLPGPGDFWKFAYTRFQGNSKICTVDLNTGKKVCTYNVTSYCTAATTPPTMDTTTLPNEEDSVGFPVFFEAYGVCFNFLLPGEPWVCRGITSLPTRINTFPRGNCTVLPLP